ncbi:MAG TPA: RICIN domain-containing protein [Herpetosiphonaceae bacterium]|nr:RICIN domain-containing protein [Herpetosiphonaceae bacterium]
MFATEVAHSHRRLIASILFAFLLTLGISPIAAKDKDKPSEATAPLPAPACSRPEDFRPVSNLGNACKMPDNTWKVLLPDGSIMISHGPDPSPQVIRDSEPSARAVTSAYNCVSGNNYHALILYIYPTDRASQYSSRLGTIRTYVQAMQDKLNSESQRFGVTSALNLACDADGQVTVRPVALGISSAQHDLGAITNDLKAKGYNSTYQKYWMVYEQPSCGGGVAWAEMDDRAIVDNGANRGPSYGVSWGFCGFDTLMHEAGHTLGAVMNSAPNTTGAGHCIDGNDIMCYNDGGPRGAQFTNNVCTDYQHWDCNFNDYYNPSPAAGSYLATHWNIGACYMRFITRSGCGTPPPPPPPSGGAYFTLVNRYTGKCLDLNNASTADGAKIQQWTCNNSNAQQWRLVAAGNGGYQLVSRASGKCADVAAWSTADGAFVNQWACGANQANQQWNVEAVADGWVRLASRHSGKYVSLVNGSTADGTQIHVWPWLGNPDQQWRLAPVGAVTLVNKNSSKCADVDNGGTGDGVNIRQWNCNGTNAQKWNFQHVDNGWYRIANQNSGKLVDVNGNSTADGANIHQWSNTGCACQQWRIETLGDGSFRLVARHSGKVFDVAGSGTGDGVNIQQWTWNGSNAQRFFINN